MLPTLLLVCVGLRSARRIIVENVRWRGAISPIQLELGLIENSIEVLTSNQKNKRKWQYSCCISLMIEYLNFFNKKFCNGYLRPP